jgi:succinate-acetate transporter protein
MPAGDTATMSGASMVSDASSGAKTTNGWASPAILGFLAFGMTIILFGLSKLPKPYGNGFVGFAGVPATEAVLGGAVLGLVGLITLWKGHLYWGSAFLGYAAFWITLTESGTFGYGSAGFAFIWLLFTLTFLLSSFKHGWGTFFFLLFLFVGFILLLIEFWQMGAGTKISSGEMWAVGGEWIFTGLIAWYAGTADLTNHTYNKRVLPI